jgi:predicted Zn-dependent protease
VADTIGIVRQPPALEAYVQEIGRTIAENTEQPNLPWTFAIVDDAGVNAFALPGGKIFITRGLLARLSNGAQLSTVLGHECGHVTARHSAERMSKAQLAELGLGATAIFVEPARELMPLASAGMNLLFLKFSRDDEYQADELGVRYSSRAGFDVREMPEVFRTLERASKSSEGAKLPEWLSTHPSSENRIERVEGKIAQVESGTEGKDPEPYLRAVKGLVYGEDPRAGYFQGDRFIHPELRFAFSVPAGWKHQNFPQAVIAVSPDEGAMLQLTLSATKDPEAALANFGQQKGVRMGQPADLVPDLRSASARFEAESESGPVAGFVTFVALDKNTIQIVGLTSAARFAEQGETLAKSQGSFEAIDDPKLLSVEPARIELVKVDEPTRLSKLYQRKPASVPLEEVAALNQLDGDPELRRGQTLKWVRGGTGTR